MCLSALLLSTNTALDYPNIFLYCAVLLLISAKIQQLKHSVTKGDKKKKKETTEVVAQLEDELNRRHEQELAEIKNNYEVIVPLCTLTFRAWKILF